MCVCMRMILNGFFCLYLALPNDNKLINETKRIHCEQFTILFLIINRCFLSLLNSIYNISIVNMII